MEILTMTLFDKLDHLQSFLFDHEAAFIKTQITKLIRENDKLRQNQGQSPLFGFLFEGKPYRLEEPPVWHSHLLGILEDLEPQMQSILDTEKAQKKEVRQVRQNLKHILEPAKDIQQVRDALPECLVAAFSDLTGMERNQQPAWSIRDNPKALASFNKLLPLMEAYSMTRLVY